MSAIPENHRFAFETAAALACGLLDAATTVPHSSPLLLNVNVPPAPRAGRFRLTKLGRRGYLAQVEERRDPRGRLYYWIGGPEREHEDIQGSDCNAVFDDSVASVTPLSVDLTRDQILAPLAAWRVPGFERG
jgi:5'-nucleotidase